MNTIKNLIYGLLIAFVANIFSISQSFNISAALVMALFLAFAFINVFPSYKKVLSKKLKICNEGCDLLKIFVVSLVPCLLYNIIGILGVGLLPSITENIKYWLLNFLIAFLLEAIIFWNGMIRIYFTSKQLGIKYRVLGLMCGFIPILNLIMLSKMVKAASLEVEVENGLLLRDNERVHMQICHTKYPILMVHGVFFRDFKYFNIGEEYLQNLRKMVLKYTMPTISRLCPLKIVQKKYSKK